jgi:hypothetical protein
MESIRESRVLESGEDWDAKGMTGYVFNKQENNFLCC